MNLPFLKDLTAEYVLLMVNKYRVSMKQEPAYLEIQVQNLLDKSQARINLSNSKTYMSYAA